MRSDETMIYGLINLLEKPMSRLVLGTAPTSTSTGLDDAVLNSIHALGCNAFDTARIYGHGDVEQQLGAWIRRRQIRREVILITKGGHPTLHQPNRLSMDYLTRDIEASLRALGTNEIDVFLLHRDNAALPVSEIIDSLNKTVKQGKIRLFGAANWSAQRIAEAQAFASENGLQGFQISSPHFSLGEWNREPWPGCWTIAGKSRQVERQWYAENRLPVLAWSSLAAGFFSGRMVRRRVEDIMSPSDRLRTEVYLSSANVKRLRRARALARLKGVEVAQIALAYVLSEPINVFAIVSCSQLEHFRRNLAALDTTLSSEERQWLNLET